MDRNKRSIQLNLKSDEGREVLYRLADDADILLEGYRPGVVKRLGVDYDTLSKRNPRLIYCSISGFGQTGPYSKLVGHDINYISIGGALGIMGDPKTHKPMIPQNLVADFAGGGLMAAFSIVCAVIARQTTGRGQYVDIAMSDGVLSLLTSAASSYFATGNVPRPGSGQLAGSIPHYNVYESEDGRWFGIGSLEPYFYANLCKVLGCEQYVEHQNTKDAAKQQEISDYFTKTFKTKTADEWFVLLTEVDVCAAPILTLEEAYSDPHNVARNMVVEIPGLDGAPARHVGIAPKLSDTPGRVRFRPPMPGEHTDDVLKSLGYDAATIAAMRAKESVA